MKTGTGKIYRHIRRSGVLNPNPNTGNGGLTTTNGVGGTAVHYFEIGGSDDSITSCMIRWFDATSSATIVLETTNLSVAEAAYNSTNLQDWFTEPYPVAGPVAAAAGCFMLHFVNSGSNRHRLKVTVAANTSLDLIPGGVH